MKRKIIGIIITGMFLLASVTALSTAGIKAGVSRDTQPIVTSNNEPLKIDICRGIRLRGIKFYVSNQAIYEGATNVTVVSVNLKGNIKTNFETPQKLADWLCLYDCFVDREISVFGFGSFTVTITVTCDECGDVSATASGFIFGHITYIK